MSDALWFPSMRVCDGLLPTSFKGEETCKTLGFSGLSPARYLSKFPSFISWWVFAHMMAHARGEHASQLCKLELVIKLREQSNLR